MAKTKSSGGRSTMKTLLPALVAIVIVIVVGLLAYKHYHKSNKINLSSNNSASRSTVSSDGDNSASEASKGTSPTTGPIGSGTSASSSSTSEPSFTVQIVSANVNDGNVHIGTLVSGTTSGSCILTAEKTGQTTLQLGSSSVVQDVNNYDCGVFNIATTHFPVTGTWTLVLTVSNDGSSESGRSQVTI